jgi:hypothetical protein
MKKNYSFLGQVIQNRSLFGDVKFVDEIEL